MSRSPPHTGQPRSRPQNGVATPSSTGRVATSIPCCDQPLLLPQKCPCRDPKPWSRHQTTTRQPEPYRDINRCRDTVSPTQPQARLRHQYQVATLLETNLCRDIKSMSRPPTLSPMSRHQIHVATPFLPTVGFPGRDAKLQVATSHTATHVATSKMMSRPQLSSTPFLLRRDANFSMSRPPLLPPMSRPQNDVATSIPTGQNPRSSILRPTATQRGRDAISWSRPHVQPNQVATSNPCRDLNRS